MRCAIVIALWSSLSLGLVGCKREAPPAPSVAEDVTAVEAAPTPAQPEAPMENFDHVDEMAEAANDTPSGVPLLPLTPQNARAIAITTVTRVGEAKSTCGESGAGWPRRGVRTVGCHLLSLVPYTALAPLSGQHVFRSGPHSAEALRFDARQDFGHYEPAFVKWAVETLAPGAGDVEVQDATRAQYEQYLQPLARTLYVAQAELERDAARREFHVRRYRALMANDWHADVDALAGLLERSPLRKVAESSCDSGDETGLSMGAATAFWLRRDIDGTRAQFAAGLRTVVMAYDDPCGLAVEKALKTAGTAPAWTGTDAAQAVTLLWSQLDAVMKEKGDPSEGTRGVWRFLYPGNVPLWSGAMVGLAPFLSGQPSGDRLDLTQRANFGRYNPEFVAWLNGVALAHYGTPEGIAGARKAYETHLRPLARHYLLAWRAYETDAAALAKDLTAFKAGVDDGSLPKDWYRGLVPPGTAAALAAAGGVTVTPKLLTEAQAFWLRRKVDGTAAAFAEGLGRLLGAFDAEFQKAVTSGAPAPAAMPEAAVGPKAEVVPAPAVAPPPAAGKSVPPPPAMVPTARPPPPPAGKAPPPPPAGSAR